MVNVRESQETAFLYACKGVHVATHFFFSSQSEYKIQVPFFISEFSIL